MYHPSATPFSGLSHEAQDHTFQPNILRFPPTAVFISSRIIFPFIWNHFPLTSCIPDDLGKPYSTPWQIHTAMDEFANLPSSLFPLPYPSYLPEFRTHSPPQWGWHSPAQTSVVLLKCSCKNQSQEAPAPPYHWPSEQKKSRKKKSGQLDREIQSIHPDTTLLGWDPSLQQRGIFQTLLRPEICCQTHTQRLLPSAP